MGGGGWSSHPWKSLQGDGGLCLSPIFLLFSFFFFFLSLCTCGFASGRESEEALPARQPGPEQPETLAPSHEPFGPQLPRVPASRNQGGAWLLPGGAKGTGDALGEPGDADCAGAHGLSCSSARTRPANRSQGTGSCPSPAASAHKASLPGPRHGPPARGPASASAFSALPAPLLHSHPAGDHPLAPQPQSRTRTELQLHISQWGARCKTLPSKPGWGRVPASPLGSGLTAGVGAPSPRVPEQRGAGVCRAHSACPPYSGCCTRAPPRASGAEGTSKESCGVVAGDRVSVGPLRPHPRRGSPGAAPPTHTHRALARPEPSTAFVNFRFENDPNRLKFPPRR